MLQLTLLIDALIYMRQLMKANFATAYDSSVYSLWHAS